MAANNLVANIFSSTLDTVSLKKHSMSKSSRAAFGTYSTKPIKKAVQAPVITQAVSAPAPLASLEAKEELKSEPKPVVIESKAVEQVLEELNFKATDCCSRMASSIS